MKPEGFPAAIRLRKRREFLQIQGAGAKHHLRHFLVFMSPTSLSSKSSASAASVASAASAMPPRRPGDETLVRLGVTVTRKVGPAVVRNRIKRYVREAFRRKRGSFTPGCDMVWVAKQSAASVGYAEVAAAMDALTRRVPPGAAC
ncbi:MAG: ribonuclease P protein component [Nannocystis sp.]|nr:ribonuclease P protein component [Nannocystis sp.]MBA3549109.1 ribonuclease P protein component [Nannocystis sp.]